MAVLGNARVARPTARQSEISRAGRAARAPRVAPGTPPGFGGPPVGGGTPAPGSGGTTAPGPGPQAGGGGGNIGLGQGERPGLGHQLTRRVQSGALTGQQAQRTVQERQTLKKAFGSDWRQHVFGGAGKVQQARAQLAASPNDPRLLALNQRLLQQRKSMLSAAKQKIGGGGKGGGRVNPQGRGFMNPPGQSY